MAHVRFSYNTIINLFCDRKIATMPELKAALGTNVDMTIFRKLKELHYRSSYSQRGKYYTLDRIAEFDQKGLWFHDQARFSQRGSLLNTVDYFVTSSVIGYTVGELDEELQIETQESLLRLVQCGRIVREKLGGLYLYCSRDQVVHQGQWETRSQFKKESPGVAVREEKNALHADEIKAAIVLFFSTLDEKQRRLYAGLESIKLGHGGDKRIGELLGLDAHTIAKGRGELVEQDLEWERIRRAGGGRPSVKKNSRSNQGY